MTRETSSSRRSAAHRLTCADTVGVIVLHDVAVAVHREIRLLEASSTREQGLVERRDQTGVRVEGIGGGATPELRIHEVGEHDERRSRHQVSGIVMGEERRAFNLKK